MVAGGPLAGQLERRGPSLRNAELGLFVDCRYAAAFRRASSAL